MTKFFYNDDKARAEAERYINTDNLPTTHDLKLWLKQQHIYDCNDLMDWIDYQIHYCSTNYKGFSEELKSNQREAITDWLTRSIYQARDDYYSISEKLDHDDDPENW